MKPLTKKDMYDEKGKPILPKITLKKYMARSKYQPHQGTKEKSKRIVL